MKKVKFEGKLALGKGIVAKLNDEYMKTIMGAATCATSGCPGQNNTCDSTPATCCGTLCQIGSCATSCGTVNCQ